MRRYRFKRITKGGRKAKKGQKKSIRQGARLPGAGTQGSIRRPY